VIYREAAFDLLPLPSPRARGNDEPAAPVKVKRSPCHTHTHTDREQHPRHTHTHDKNNTPNPQTNTPHNHLTTLEGERNSSVLYQLILISRYRPAFEIFREAAFDLLPLPSPRARGSEEAAAPVKVKRNSPVSLSFSTNL